MSDSKYCKHCEQEHALTSEFWSRLDSYPICRLYKRSYDKDNYKKQSDKIKENKKVYYKNNKSTIMNTMNIYRYKRRHSDSNFRLITNLRSRLNSALKKNHKKGSAVQDLGCSIDELKIHLESKFQEGMTWDNYGPDWHVDHIRPLSKYDLTDKEVLAQLVHYTNLQPLWAADNIRKSNKE